jgi:hypothetical protein
VDCRALIEPWRRKDLGRFRQVQQHDCSGSCSGACDRVEGFRLAARTTLTQPRMQPSAINRVRDSKERLNSSITVQQLSALRVRVAPIKSKVETLYTAFLQKILQL